MTTTTVCTFRRLVDDRPLRECMENEKPPWRFLPVLRFWQFRKSWEFFLEERRGILSRQVKFLLSEEQECPLTPRPPISQGKLTLSYV